MGFFDSIKTGFGGGARAEADPEQMAGSDAGEVSAPAPAAPAPSAAQQEASAELYRIYQRKRVAFRKLGEAVYTGEAANEELLGRYAGLVRDIRSLELREEELSDRLDAAMLGGLDGGWGESAPVGEAPAPVTVPGSGSGEPEVSFEAEKGSGPTAEHGMAPFGACPACGAPLEPDALFCAECGARLEAAPTGDVPTPGGLGDVDENPITVVDEFQPDSTPDPGVPAAAPFGACPACGAPLEPDALFCAECGARVIDVAPAPGVEPTPSDEEPDEEPGGVFEVAPEKPAVESGDVAQLEGDFPVPEFEPASDPGAPAAAPFGLCPACGAPLEPDALFCAECGARLEAAPAGDVPAPDGFSDVDESPTTVLDESQPDSAPEPGVPAAAPLGVCPACGAPLEPGALFCAECGARVEEPQDAEPPASTAPATCPVCGAPLEEGYRFCGECGAPVPDGGPAPEPVPASAFEPRRCPVCGAEASDGAFFCAECGARL